MQRGSCLCGEVRFEVDGPLTPIELCHCAKCKKAYGTAFAATLYTRSESFRWLAGEEHVSSYDAPLEQSPPAYRHCFCTGCGSPAPISWEGFPVVEIPVSALDGPVDRRPVYHMYECQKAAWFEIRDALPRYDEGAPLAEKVIQALR
jgi:hypothetical protein